MRKATFSATFWRFVGDAKSKSCENIWHLVSRASLNLCVQKETVKPLLLFKSCTCWLAGTAVLCWSSHLEVLFGIYLSPSM